MGVLGTGTAQKMGALGADTTRKRGGGCVLVAAYKPDIGYRVYLFIIFILLTGGGVFWQT